VIEYCDEMCNLVQLQFAIMEAIELSDKLRIHLESCSRTTWKLGTADIKLLEWYINNWEPPI